MPRRLRNPVRVPPPAREAAADARAFGRPLLPPGVRSRPQASAPGLKRALPAAPQVASAAVLALGLASAGTNNARVAGQLRQLGAYHYKEPGLLFLVR